MKHIRKKCVFTPQIGHVFFYPSTPPVFFLPHLTICHVSDRFLQRYFSRWEQLIGILLQRILTFMQNYVQKQGYVKKGPTYQSHISVSNSVTKSVELHLHCSFVCRYCDVTKAFGKEQQHVKVVSSNNSPEINKKEQTKSSKKEALLDPTRTFQHLVRIIFKI